LLSQKVVSEVVATWMNSTKMNVPTISAAKQYHTYFHGI
jgi:hypothetical protein